MNKEETNKLINKVIEIAENRVLQSSVMSIIAVISIWLFVLAYTHNQGGYWFLALAGFNLLNLLFINSGSRKYVKIGKYFCLLMMVTTLLLALFSLLMYIAIFIS